MSLNSIGAARIVRGGHMPQGCSVAATSTEPEELYWVMQVGNRATRREAKRNLIKQLKKPQANAAIQKETL